VPACHHGEGISKVFTLALAIEKDGEALWTRVGREPSGTSFNSLVQLEYERVVMQSDRLSIDSA
jgi:glutaminase